ncbi:MAG: hypothetical protein ACD_62C00426G0003 [uncultured bacterium]|nr:MAG: hypothetical protein ACD_62C00426G0003 [uncultured bacterium]
MLRDMEPREGAVSVAYGAVNRSKRSLGLDLKKSDAQTIIGRLIQKYDVLVEGFRSGVMSKLGLGYETLKELNPALIYCSITGYGQTGPYSDRAGHDINFVALSGSASYTGRKESGPLPLGTQMSDLAGSYNAALGILAAVVSRKLTGRGQHIDVSMSDGMLALNVIAGAGFAALGLEPDYEDSILNGGGTYDYYQTCDGRYFSVGCLEPKFFKRLCEAAGCQNKNTVTKKELKNIFKTKTFDEWREIFANSDACVEPVLKFSEVAEHPHFKARGMFVPVDKRDGNTQRQIAFPVKFSGNGTDYKHVGPTPGHDTRQVLAEAGFLSEEISEFFRTGVVAAGQKIY